MALNPLVDSRDLRFVLFEALGVDKLNQYENLLILTDTFEATLNWLSRLPSNRFIRPTRSRRRKIDPQ